MNSPLEVPSDLAPSDLVRFFEQAQRRDPSTHLIGTELEKFGLVAGDNGAITPVRYHEHILPVLEGLVSQFDWEVGPDRGTNGEIVELRRDGASITLEPGGQLELSGAPLVNVHQTCAEFTEHYRELDAVSKPLNLTWIAAGHHPFATRDEINWMPKDRYAVMREYLPKRGTKALDMMLRTCTVQANFDYSSEANCRARLRTASAIAPIVTAMFANSPYVEGNATGWASNRARVWTDVDPDRCGVQPFFFDGSFTFERYVDWALDVPMFFVKRDGRYHPFHAPFRTFMAEGFTDGHGNQHRATWDDWVTHLSTVFPEIRLKPHLEFRSADSVGSRYVCALPALLKGILYDDDATEAVWERLQNFSFEERLAFLDECNHHGLHSPRVLDMARFLLDLARSALNRQNVRDSAGRTESRFLNRLTESVNAGLNPGDIARAALGDAPGRDVAAQHAFLNAFHFAGVFG